MTNTELLRDKIRTSGLKIEYIANQLNLSSYGLSRKIDNKSEFKASEIAKMCVLLGIDEVNRNAIFFAA